MALIFAPLRSWWDLVWHSLAHAREPTTTPRVKPITFSGRGETWGVKGSSFVPLLPLHSPLFSSPFFLSADLFICSWGLATMGLWLHSLTWAGNDFKFSGLHLWILNKETIGGWGYCMLRVGRGKTPQWFTNVALRKHTSQQSKLIATARLMTGYYLAAGDIWTCEKAGKLP